jgi:hypothetical protein
LTPQHLYNILADQYTQTFFSFICIVGSYERVKCKEEMKQTKMNYSRFIVIFALQLHVLIEAELYIKDPIDYGLISNSLPTNADFIPG